MKLHLAIIAGLVIALSAASYFFLSHKDAQNAAAQQPASEGLPVTAMTIEAKPLALFETLPGRTTAYKVAEIRPQVSGIITERLFEEGSTVEKGQQLYQIDPAPYQAAYNSAQATLKKAQANVKAAQAKAVRYAELVIIEAVSKQEYDDVVAALDQAQADVAIGRAAVATAKVDLDYTKVYAPISGRIGTSAFTQGALVTAGQAQPLATITQLDPIYVDMTQSSTDLLRLRGNGLESDVKKTVTLSVDAAGGEKYAHEGELQFSEVTVDETTSSVKLRATFPNPEGTLLPGLFVKASIQTGQIDNAILVPQRAAMRGPDGTLMVWVIGPDGMVNPRPIKTVREIDGQWLVSEGLQSGETVALDSFQKMQPGMPVTAMPANAEGPQGAPQGGMPPAPEAPADAMPAESPAPADGAMTAPAPETETAPVMDETPTDTPAEEPTQE